jgi:hypothetical protein
LGLSPKKVGDDIAKATGDWVGRLIIEVGAHTNADGIYRKV